jgi:hypothetical protein
MADPFGSDDSKFGRTGFAPVRLGTYQNSYSSKSYIANFSLVYYGAKNAIDNLEKAIKLQYSWNIENDGHGKTEWLSDFPVKEVERIVDDLISNSHFKVTKVPNHLLPLTADNYDKLVEYISEVNTK